MLYHILVADDERFERLVYKGFFGKQQDTQLTLVTSPEEANTALSEEQKRPYTHVISDGFNKTGWIVVVKAAIERNIPVVVISGDDLNEAVIGMGAKFIPKGSEQLRQFCDLYPEFQVASKPKEFE